jgi:hypothetical protein
MLDNFLDTGGKAMYVINPLALNNMYAAWQDGGICSLTMQDVHWSTWPFLYSPVRSFPFIPPQRIYMTKLNSVI